MKFHQLCLESPGDIPLSVSIGSKKAKTHYVMGAGIHGNEVAAIPAFVKAIERLKTFDLKSRLTFFVGNEPAVLARKRFLEYDMNRLLTFGPVLSQEHRRAKEIMSLLDTADYFIDFHQTIQPTQSSFYIFKDDPWSLDFARVLEGADICVIEPPMGNGQMSAEQYVQNQKRVGITLEVGQIGLEEEVIAKILSVILKVAQFASESSTLSWGELKERLQGKKNLKKLEIIQQVKFSDAKDQLKEGWKNLDFITAGSAIGTWANGAQIISALNSYIFFPKYPARDIEGLCLGTMPGNLCEIAVES